LPAKLTIASPRPGDVLLPHDPHRVSEGELAMRDHPAHVHGRGRVRRAGRTVGLRVGGLADGDAEHGEPTCVGPQDCSRAHRCLGMRAHLEGCPACAEEHASLLALAERER
jgi:hypothetical protein